MDNFILYALLGGIGAALICAPLGCLVVWRRMAYFGAAISHAALLGAALGLLLGVSLQLAVLVTSLIVALLLGALTQNARLGADTLLGIVAHGALALGLVLLAWLPGVRVDLLGYLFGDLLAISRADLWWIWCGGAAIAAMLARIWQPLLSLIAQRELALVDGVRESRLQLAFFLLLSLVVAVSMQVVGVLLIVSLLIIPAATARYFAGSPEMMVALAAIFGTLSVAGGIGASLLLDTPTGPSIVVIAVALFAAVAGGAGTMALLRSGRF